MKRLLKFLCVLVLTMTTAIPTRAATLPAGYTELEYIESTGTQYIDTGYAWTSTTRGAEIDFIKTDGVTGSHLFGSSDQGATYKYDLNPYFASSTNKSCTTYVGNTGYASYNFSNNVRYNAKFNLDTTLSLSVNDATPVTANVAYIPTTGVSVYLFHVHVANQIQTYSPSKLKLYNFKMFDNGTIVRNFVPAKNASGVIGLYDTVNDVFYTNAGTGAFTAGPAKCRNLYNPATMTANKYINASGAEVSSVGNAPLNYTDFIKVQAGMYYTISVSDRVGTAANVGAFNWFSSKDLSTILIARNTYQISTNLTDYTASFVAPTGAEYLIINFINGSTVQIEQGETATAYVPYCVVNNEIKIATTKYTEDAFAGLMTTLSEAITKVTNIVDTTVQQATEIGNLATTKQDRPDTDCPAGRKCLLIMGADNKPHWYLIQE